MARRRNRDDGAGVYLVLCLLGGLWVVVKFGWQWLLAALFLISIIAALLVLHRKRREQAAFDAIVIQTINDKPDPAIDKRRNAELLKSGQMDRADVLRSVQILRDGIYHALNSKNAETAKSRYDDIERFWLSISVKRHVLGEEALSTLSAIVLDAEKKFHTAFYINQAAGLEEKASKLKTNKARVKYLQQAVNVLQDGLSDGRGDFVAINAKLLLIEELTLDIKD
jgi:hypothetical protein